MDTETDATMLRFYVITRSKIEMTAAQIDDELLQAWNNKANLVEQSEEGSRITIPENDNPSAMTFDVAVHQPATQQPTY